MKVAIMQPYFIPYAGYFRLFTSSDLFVIYDCVQFPRRGWVHRNQLLTHNGQKKWLTLPMQKCPRETPIHALGFTNKASELIHDRLNSLNPRIEATCIAREFEELYRLITQCSQTIVDYLQRILEHINTLLGIKTPIIRSSTLNIDPQLKKQDRIVEICRAINAKEYINSPGGCELYDPGVFLHHGIKLFFLNNYQGSMLSIFQRLLCEGKEDIAHDIHKQTILLP